jgi:tetratricopeptide (TPR) repeat protein
LTRAIELDPKLEGAYCVRADIYRGRRQWESAIQNYEEALRLKPGAARNHLWRGFCYKELKKFDDALADLSDAIKRAGGDKQLLLDAYATRWQIYIALKRDREGIADASRAIAINPELWDAYQARGDLHLRQRHLEQARQDLKCAARRAHKGARPSSIAWEEVEVTESCPQDLTAVRSQPAIEHGGIYGAEIDLVFEISAAQPCEAGMVAVNPALDARP